MLKFIIRRLLWTIPVMFGVVFIVFTIDRFAPGDPVSRELGASYTQEQYDAKKAELGLDRPFLEQFFSYIAGIFHGDLGTSYHTGIPVAESIANRWPTSFKLGILSVIFAVIIGIPLGVISAVRHNTFVDRILTCWSLVFAAMPGFWLALMLMILFAINVKWFPASFNAELGLRSWVLPCLSAGLTFIATLTRMTRSSMLDVVRQDYITTARAKGQKESVVICRHALRNALIPVITVVGFHFGIQIGGSVVVETIFAMPGLGSLLMTALNNRDYPVIESCVLLLSGMICIVNLLTDVAYGFADPRIMAMYTGGKKKRKKSAQKGGA